MATQSVPRRPSSTSSFSSSGENELGGSNPQRANTIHLTPNVNNHNHPYSNSTGLNDPRSSSTQSLRPVESAGPNRRTLLLVFIHGFMGNETSFKSFPAHVHSLLTGRLSESHVVYTKIYPRYQSRKNISFARDAFSNWLAPHETDKTDVILIGHSLGGILAAEVALLPSHTPGSERFFQHRILGTIAYDTPFLGMHPGVVGTGIASLFRPSDQPQQADDTVEPSIYGLSEPDLNDPNYNPALENDVKLPVRKNKIDRAWYFFNKHYNLNKAYSDVTKAASSYVKSHLEFGGCMADYQGLHKRYDNIRRLEDIHDVEGIRTAKNRIIPRVRFVNYYTASTGRIKEQPQADQNQTLTVQSEMTSMTSQGQTTPRISVTSDDISRDLSELDIDHETEMHQVEPRPSTPSSDGYASAQENTSNDLDNSSTQNTGITSSSIDLSDLPPIPSVPKELPTFDASIYKDLEVLKLAQKDYDRKKKAYEREVKDREEAIKDREKIIAKRQKKAAKEKEKNEKEGVKRQATLNEEPYNKQLASERTKSDMNTSTKPAKKQKDRKFCTLPKKDAQTGRRDPTWIRVYMEGMDEVVAHTSLFFLSEAYAKLVEDTSDRIEDWIHEDAKRRRKLAVQRSR